MNKVVIKPITYRILEQILQSGKIQLDELTVKSEFDPNLVASEVESLYKNNLIDKIVKTVIAYELTSRGKEALEKGLIENRLFQLLTDKERVSMQSVFQEVKGDKQEISAGIGLLKRKKFINIKNGEISLNDKASFESFVKENTKMLAMITSIKPPISQEIEELIGRGLIQTSEVQITKIIPKIDEIQLKEIKVQEELTKLTPELIASGRWKNYVIKPYNIKTKPRRLNIGKYHIYRHFHDFVRQNLMALGFQEMKGSLVEMEFWNFDSLYSPQDHPSREDQDIFLINPHDHGILPKEEFVENVRETHETGWKTGSKGHRYSWDYKKASRFLLRPQGTTLSARTLRNVKPPAKYFSIAKCFRPDDIDATHGAEFYQVEGIVCDPSLTFRDLLGILTIFAEDIAGAENISFRPDYYPFTSPSVELSAEHPTIGRIEFGGAGIFRPEVVQPFGIDYPVIAWGLGIDRLFMVKHNISDIRELFSQDLEWLRQSPVSSGINME